MKKYNFYEIYGLIVKSEIPLYSSILFENPPSTYDVQIVEGVSKKKIYEKSKSVGMFNFYTDYITFNVNNVASYEIINGNEIYITPSNNYDLEEIRKFTLGSALGLLLFQRNIIALHGGAISIENNGVIISGSIGAGKSTTISTLVNNGHSFLTDDVSSLTKGLDGHYYVNHCIPYQKLCKSTVEMLGYDASQLIQIDKTKDKYFSPEIKNFVKEPVKLKALFYITTYDGDNVNHKEITGAEKFKMILSNIFRQEFIPKELYKPIFIKECISLSSRLPIYKIYRPKNKDSVNEVISTIENLTLKESS